LCNRRGGFVHKHALGGTMHPRLTQSRPDPLLECLDSNEDTSDASLAEGDRK
jgi:hypothetical protein